ncbi:MAG TPA: hypothetical protein VJV04_08460 [Nitrospiraceae bacterium]|nr:hypothetical protein [Nitrospiraceae bacterium]
MTEQNQLLNQAINRLSESDPIIKLLHEVKLGRMKPTDPGLRAITESWIETYRQVLQDMNGLERSAWPRLDPHPRLEFLIDAGVLPTDHPSVANLKTTFEQMLADAEGHA